MSIIAAVVYILVSTLILLAIRDMRPTPPPGEVDQLRRRQLEREITESRTVRWRPR